MKFTLEVTEVAWAWFVGLSGKKKMYVLVIWIVLTKELASFFLKELCCTNFEEAWKNTACPRKIISIKVFPMERSGMNLTIQICHSVYTPRTGAGKTTTINSCDVASMGKAL